MYGYVYLILNKENGKTYIGQHKSSNTWSEDHYMGSGKLLKRAKAKYGIENFEKFLIQYCETRDELNNQEEFWIAEYRKRGKAEYNIANGGQGGIMVEHPQAWNKGLKMTDEWMKEHPNGAIGHLWPTTKGRKKTPEQIENNRKAQKKYWSQHKSARGSKGMKWYNNGIEQVLCLPDDKPLGYIEGMLSRGKPSWNSGEKMPKEYCENNRKAQKEYASRADYVNPASGRHWYTNGTVNVFTYKCPIGYKPGMARSEV